MAEGKAEGKAGEGKIAPARESESDEKVVEDLDTSEQESNKVAGGSKVFKIGKSS